MVLCLGESPGGFCDVGCCSSFIAVFVMLAVVIFTFPGYFSMPPAFHPGFWDSWRSPPPLSSTLATLDCFTFPSHFYRECYGFDWAFFTHRRFLPYIPSPHLAQPAFIKASLGPGSSSLKVAGPPTKVRNIDAAYLFVWITQCSAKGISRFYLRVTTGRLMKNLLLTGFELFSR